MGALSCQSSLLGTEPSYTLCVVVCRTGTLNSVQRQVPGMQRDKGVPNYGKSAKPAARLGSDSVEQGKSYFGKGGQRRDGRRGCIPLL